MKKPSLAISACLAGFPCRYDGSAAPLPCLSELAERYELICLCPEQLAGLPTPRSSAELVGERVLAKDGRDVTEAFYEGARKALLLAREQGCIGAVLMDRSPSCGSSCVYDGNFNGTLIEGRGVFARMLGELGCPLYTPKTLQPLMEAKTACCEPMLR